MNTFVLSGRLVRDPHRIQDKDMCFITLAVDDQYTRNGDERRTSYPSVLLVGNAAKFAAKYLRKGRLVAVSGRIGTYNKEVDGQQQTVLSLRGFEIEALDSPKRESSTKKSSKKEQEKEAPPEFPEDPDPYDDDPDDDWDNIPF